MVSSLVLAANFILVSSFRLFPGAPRFKPKMVNVKPLKTPSMLALDHFDFYYAPLFGNVSIEVNQ
jgi:hypothetical protein